MMMTAIRPPFPPFLPSLLLPPPLVRAADTGAGAGLGAGANGQEKSVLRHRAFFRRKHLGLGGPRQGIGGRNGFGGESEEPRFRGIPKPLGRKGLICQVANEAGSKRQRASKEENPLNTGGGTRRREGLGRCFFGTAFDDFEGEFPEPLVRFDERSDFSGMNARHEPDFFNAPLG